jgi:hypothetical protein
MGLKKLAEKLSDYNTRLELGKAEKIEAGHVRKVMEKLQKKSAQLQAEIAQEEKADKKARLERKLGVAREHVERAQWLLAQIE